MKWFWLWPILMSIAAFWAMARDKALAKAGARRIPESTLLSLAVLGGGPGALLAMLLCRHKTRKLPFALGLPLIALVQAAVIWMLLRTA